MGRTLGAVTAFEHKAIDACKELNFHVISHLGTKMIRQDFTLQPSLPLENQPQ
jgi:hypothetical protein